MWDAGYWMLVTASAKREAGYWMLNVEGWSCFLCLGSCTFFRSMSSSLRSRQRWEKQLILEFIKNKRMIKNLLHVALRNFMRDKWYSLLNILGLTIGITFSVFLILYITDELSYDRYNEKADRIYRVASYVKEPDKDTMKWAFCPFPMGPSLSADYPEVEEAV